MKVSEAIKLLGELKPDEEIAILWWDYEWLSNSGEDNISDSAIAHADKVLGDNHWVQERIGEILNEAIMEYYEDLERD